MCDGYLWLKNHEICIWTGHRYVLSFILHEDVNVDTEEGAQKKKSDILEVNTVIDTGKVTNRTNKTITTEIEEL